MKALELFAGVGGFRIGLERAGVQVVWSNQWEPSTKAQHASSCYEANFGSANHSNEDIALAIDADLGKIKVIPDADLVVGGFPCQDYSVAKSLRSSTGIEGKKGVLWWEIYRLIEAKRPKLVFLENVDRLLKSPSKQRGRDFAVMLKTLGDLGYIIEWRVVNAADYGFPQRRIRTFIVGIRRDLMVGDFRLGPDSFSTGVLNSSLPIVRVDSVTELEISGDVSEISAEFNAGGKKSPFLNSGFYLDGVVMTATVIPNSSKANRGTLGSVLLPDSEVPAEFWVDEQRLPEWRFLKGAKSLDRVSSSGHAYKYSEGKMAFPDNLDKPSRTILTGEGGSSPSRFKHIIETESGYRRLTPIELERLNGFPDNWTKFDFTGASLTDAKRAFFMGNALVVGLIEMVAHELQSRFGA